jgi:hypothetical protein
VPYLEPAKEITAGAHLSAADLEGALGGRAMLLTIIDVLLSELKRLREAEKTFDSQLHSLRDSLSAAERKW